MTSLQVHAADLEPSLVDRQTYMTRRWRNPLDAGSLLSLTVVFALLLPAGLIVPQMTGIGRPALLLGMVLAIGWSVAKLHPRLAVRGPQPLRWAAAFYLIAILMAYASALLRGLPALEANAAERYLISTVIFLGIALVCADGLSNRARLDDVLRTIIWAGAVMAIIGHLQAVLKVDLAARIQIPGLVNHSESIGFADRGFEFFRVASTAAHFIEFSTVMAFAVPLGIHVTRFSRSGLTRQFAGISTALIAAAIPITLSRTGILALAIGLLVMAPAWNWRMRLNVGMLTVAMTCAVMVVRPGLLGTIRSLFSNAESDPSVQTRTEDYAATASYIAERPLLGRGPGTFIPTLYRWIDNEWLLHLITAGFIGAVALATIHLTAVGLAFIAYRRAKSEEDRHICAALISAQFMAMAVAATFDAMSFSTHTTMLALLTGMSGAMWRFTHPSRRVRNATTHMAEQNAIR